MGRRFPWAELYGQFTVSRAPQEAALPKMPQVRLLWEYHRQDPLEIPFSIYRMGDVGRHNQSLAGMNQMLDTSHCKPAGAFQHVDKGVSCRTMGADFLSFGKGEQGHTQSAVLGQSLAHNLPRLHLDLLWTGSSWRTIWEWIAQRYPRSWGK